MYGVSLKVRGPVLEVPTYRKVRVASNAFHLLRGSPEPFLPPGAMCSWSSPGAPQCIGDPPMDNRTPGSRPPRDTLTRVVSELTTKWSLLSLPDRELLERADKRPATITPAEEEHLVTLLERYK